jgi:two-component system sensor histidine kinase UhpB
VSNDRAVRAGAQPDALLLDAASLAETGLKAVRKVITDLRPSVLDQLGIWAALEWYAGQVEERSGILCDWTIDDNALAIELDQERSTMLFRVVQEALTNVVRHARASSVAVNVAASVAAITVLVKDDGMGIDTERLLNRESWGILGMYERVRHFGGELRITGTPGQGTSVFLQLPLEHSHA